MASKREGKYLRVARELNLPIDAATQKIAWLGRTGSGKTFATKRMVEQMLRALVQVVILDGSGSWAGLRRGPKAFKIPVFGGLYGDIPLEPTAGALVADVIVDRRISVVLDVSQMTDADRTRFATAFAQRFFQRQKASPSAVHLVLEECQDYVPENHQRGEERMLHEFQRLAKQGRPHGIGISFISQRPQEISKKALNQAECVFAFQMNGPQERKALKYWLSDKGFEGDLADVLPTLEVGHPYVWSPQWLKVSKIVEILPIDTVDTSQTPKVGKRGKVKSRGLKPIDLKALNVAMAETIERAKADDPAALRIRIAELEKELKANGRALKLSEELRTVVPSKKGVTLGEFEIVVDRRHVEELVALSESFESKVAACQKTTIAGAILVFEDLRRSANETIAAARRARATGPGALAKRIEKAGPSPKEAKGRPGNSTGCVAVARRLQKEPSGSFLERPPPASMILPSMGLPMSVPVRARSSESNGAIGGGLRRMMIALAQRPGLTNRQIGVRAGISSKSGTFSTYLSRARTEGWIVYDGDRRSLTPAGEAALGSWEPLPQGQELLDYWIRELGGGGARMLSALASAYPNALTKEQLGQASGISHKSGTFSTYISRLRTLELVEGRGELRASADLVS